MPKVKNKLFQPLTILLSGKKSLYLGSREESSISKADVDSAHLQAMISSGDVALAEESPKKTVASKTTKKSTSKPRKRRK